MCATAVIPDDFKLFIGYTERMNTLAIWLQDTPQETISAKDILKACYCVKFMLLESSFDIVLFLSALNLCNTYVKQKNHHSSFSYGFKTHVIRAVSALSSIKCDNCYYDIQEEHGMNLVVFQLGSIQFSFHQVPRAKELISEASDNYRDAPIKWDSVRKQNCAKSLFDMAFSNPYNSSKTTSGADLHQSIDKLFKCGMSEKMLSDILSFKTLD